MMFTSFNMRGGKCVKGNSDLIQLGSKENMAGERYVAVVTLAVCILQPHCNAPFVSLCFILITD